MRRAIDEKDRRRSNLETLPVDLALGLDGGSLAADPRPLVLATWEHQKPCGSTDVD